MGTRCLDSGNFPKIELYILIKRIYTQTKV
jgi:hypothetical protein